MKKEIQESNSFNSETLKIVKIRDVHREEGKPVVKWILVGISLIFVGFMLVLPLISILVNSLSQGVAMVIKSWGAEYTVSALKVTLFVTVIAVSVNTVFGIIAAWLLTRFEFFGKNILATLIDIPFSISPVIAGLAFIMTFGRMGWAYPIIQWINDTLNLNISLVFSIPGVILATIFVTFPFISREIIPVLNAAGKEQEEAAAQMGASGFTIFRKITLPQIKWALLYGVVMCTARSFGEFGAVYALSKTRGETFTLPLEIDALYMTGTKDAITQAFAVSSVLVIISIFILILRNLIEYREKKEMTR